MLLAVVTAESWQKIQKDLRRKMQIDVPGTGIAFIVPLSSIGGKRALMFLTEHQPLTWKEESTLKDTRYELLLAREAPAPRLVAPGFGQLFLVAILQHPKQSYYRTISMPPSKTDKPAPISAKTREPGVCAETLRTSPKYRTHFRKIKNIGNHIQFYTDVSITPDLPEPPRNSSEKQEAGFSTEP